MTGSTHIEERFQKAQDRLVLQAADLSLETVAAMVDRGSIDIAPRYQRRDRWGTDKQSALIESFLLNIPVPPIYLAEDDYGTYSVIDGKQRITAVHAFMRGKLRLKGLETFTDLEGMTVDDLPRELANALSVRPYFRAVTLLKQSDPELKYEVFARLNTGGERLNAQEIRNVVYRGSLNDLVYELAENRFLRDQLKISGKSSSAFRKMQDAELVLRYMTLAETWQSFSGDLSRSMDRFMEQHQHPNEAFIAEKRSSFELATTLCEDYWGTNAYRRPVGDGWRDQTLAGMYDAQMLAVTLLSQSERESLRGQRRKILRKTRDLFGDSDFEDSVRTATNTPSRIRYRVSKMKATLESLAQ